MGQSYKQYSPKWSNFIILCYHIISPKEIQQIPEKCYCTCEIQFVKGGSQSIYSTSMFHDSFENNLVS